MMAVAAAHLRGVEPGFDHRVDFGCHDVEAVTYELFDLVSTTFLLLRRVDLYGKQMRIIDLHAAILLLRHVFLPPSGISSFRRIRGAYAKIPKGWSAVIACCGCQR